MERIIAAAYKVKSECGQITRLYYWNDELDSSDVFDYNEKDELY